MASGISPSLVLIPALLSMACGASYQRVYDGDVRFEHCYRLDSDSAVSSQSRLQCWSEWRQNHTTGQARDRVAYAQRREQALRSGDTALTGPGVVTGLPATTVGTQVLALTPMPTQQRASSAPRSPAPTAAPTAPAPTAPAPTAARPPTTATASPPASAAALAPKDLSPRQLCAQDCGNSFTACVTRCDQPNCAQKCGAQVKVCLDSCL